VLRLLLDLQRQRLEERVRGGGADHHHILRAVADIFLRTDDDMIAQLAHGRAAALVAIMRHPGEARPLLQCRQIAAVQPVEETRARVVGEVVPGGPDAAVHIFKP
jgi:PAS domain-containing protein